ncbi:MAG: hypothetical protein V4850_14980 [Myxococcota bacterium]
MLWLLACAPPVPPPPALDLPVTPPAATHASGALVDEFVGPAEVAGLDAAHIETAALCGAPDRAALLHDGRFGWRVLVVTPEGLALADELGEEPRVASVLYRRLASRAARWAAADKAASARCGAPVRTPVLIVADGRSRYDSNEVGGPGILEGFDVRLLVTDAEPTPRVAAPVRREDGGYLTLAGGSGGWVVLGSTDDFPSSSHASAEEAAQRVVEAGYPPVLFTSEADWSLAVQGLDALAGIGVVPGTSLVVGDKDPPPSVAPQPPGATRLVLGERIAVLAFQPPGYLQWKGTERPKTVILKAKGEPKIVVPERPIFGPEPTEPPRGPAPAEPPRGPVRTEP